VASKRIQAEIAGAVHMLQILGQIVKNFPGTLPGTQKERIVLCCYRLGLRLMSMLIDRLVEDYDELLGKMRSIALDRNPDWSDFKLDQRNLSIGLRHRAREITDASRLTRSERRWSVAVG
jgi:hypothetical protein